MAFGSIVVGTDTWNSVGNGLYQKSTVQFGQPNDMFKISGGVSSKSGTSPEFSVTRASVTRKLEKDVTIGSSTQRRLCTFVVNITVPDGFTAAEVDALAGNISQWMTTDTLTRLLMGEA